MKSRTYTQIHKIFGADLMISDIKLKIEYLNMEKKFQEQKVLNLQYLNNEITQYENPDLINFKPTFGPSSILNIERHQNSFREGEFFQLYAYIEDSLMIGCQRCLEYFRLPIGVEKLRGTSNIDAIQLFLEESMLIDRIQLEDEWLFVENLKNLRNFLVSRNRFGKNTISQEEMEKLLAFSKNRFTVKNSDISGINIHFSNEYFFFEILNLLESLLYKIGEYDLPEVDPRSIADQLGYIE